jgi:hypothetical protein
MVKIWMIALVMVCPGLLLPTVAAETDRSITADSARGAPPILLVGEPDDPVARKLLENLQTALHFASLDCLEVSNNEAHGLTPEKLGAFRAVILASEKTPRALFGKDILAFVENGGVLFFALRGWDNDWMPQLGLSAASGENAPGFVDSQGAKSTVPVFRHVHLDLPVDSFINSASELAFSPEWQILIEFKEPAGLPLLASRQFGAGTVVFWNGTCLHLKDFRGLFLFSLLRAFPVAAMSIFNATLFHIDDSPPPAFGLKSGPVGRDLGMNDYDFYRREWYPKILGALDDDGIKIGHFPCVNYRGRVQGPFVGKSDREEIFHEILTLIKGRGDEIGFHGLNHQSLTMQASGPSRPWPSQEAMVKSLKAGRTYWETKKLPPPVVYVPPNNVIDDNGKKALTQGVPSIRAVCRLYSAISGGYAEGGGDENDAGDEFGPDPAVPQLSNIPRLSSGMFLTGEQKHWILNGIMAHGIISHFIHPDDIFDPDRSGKNWEFTFAAFLQLLRFFRTTFPEASKLRSADFLIRMKAFLRQKAEVTWLGPQEMAISSKGLGRRFYYLFSRTGRKPELTGARILEEFEPGKLFLIELEQPEARVVFPGF